MKLKKNHLNQTQKINQIIQVEQQYIQLMKTQQLIQTQLIQINR
jgi:hypothetical protein